MNASGGMWAPVYTEADLGRFVRDLRVQRGMTQAQLAEELGVSRQYVTEIERGKPTLYSERLFEILRLLGGRLRVEHVG